MASISQPSLGNAIRTDIPGINAILKALAKADPSIITDIENGTKRFYNGTNGWEFQELVNGKWTTHTKFNIDAQSVDGYNTSMDKVASTIAVRGTDGKIKADLTGKADTAGTADKLAATLAVANGGTGATTAAAARTNLGVAPTSHASSSTTYGIGSSSNYGHLKVTDTPDTAKTADTGYAFSPAGAASLKGEIDGKLSTSGGSMTGGISFPSGFISPNAQNLDLLGGNGWGQGAILQLLNINHEDPGAFNLVAFGQDGGETRLTGRHGGPLYWGGSSILTSAGGTMTGALLVSNILSGANNGFGLYGGNAWRTGGYIELSGPSSNFIQIVGGSRQILDDTGSGWRVDGSPIVTAEYSWRDGYNFYYRFSNGFSIQGGYIAFNETISVGAEKTKIITLHTPFCNNFYTSWINCKGVGVLTGGTQGQTASSFVGRAYAAAGGTRTWNGADWLAIGLM